MFDLRAGETVVAIDRAARNMRTESGTVELTISWVIATGSRPILIPVPGAELPGVVTFRDLDDVNAMLAAAEKGGNAVVIGGGLLGLEAAAGLAAKGMKTTVVHLMPTLMERQLDPNAAYLLQKAIEKRGIEVLTDANTKAILGDSKVEAVRLEDGRTLPADLVVMAVGIRPNAVLAKGRGSRSSAASWSTTSAHQRRKIFAVGECVEHRGQCYGLVAPLYEMARTLGAALAGEGRRLRRLRHVDQAQGDRRRSVLGRRFCRRRRDEIVLRDPSRGVYKRVVLRNNRIVGAVLYGDTADGAWYFDLLKKGADVAAMRDTLIFGQAYQGGGAPGPGRGRRSAVGRRGNLRLQRRLQGRDPQAIVAKGLTTLDDVRAQTKASASCGQCTSKVEALLAVTSATAIPPPAASRCANASTSRMRKCAASSCRRS